MWKHKTKWLVRGGRKVRCYLCGKKILAKGDLFLFHGDTGYYSHQSCLAESTTISGNERRKAVKKIAVGAAVVGAIAAGAGKLIDISSQSKGSLNSSDTQTILTSQGLILPALTSDPANPVAGQMWYRSDSGVTAHFDAVQNRVVYSSEINDGNVHVTSKGIINGLSVLPNDGTGWFGPDTTKGATAPGQYGSPYSPTGGLVEAIKSLPTNSLGGYQGKIVINGMISSSIAVVIPPYSKISIIGNMFDNPYADQTVSSLKYPGGISGILCTATTSSSILSAPPADPSSIGQTMNIALEMKYLLLKYENSSGVNNGLTNASLNTQGLISGGQGALDTSGVYDLDLDEISLMSYDTNITPVSDSIGWLDPNYGDAGGRVGTIKCFNFAVGYQGIRDHIAINFIETFECIDGILLGCSLASAGRDNVINLYHGQQCSSGIRLGANDALGGILHITDYQCEFDAYYSWYRSYQCALDFAYTPPSTYDNGSGALITITNYEVVGGSPTDSNFSDFNGPAGPIFMPQIKLFNGKSKSSYTRLGANITGDILTTNPPVNGTTYQNNTNLYVIVVIPITYSPTSTEDATAQIQVSNTSPATGGNTISQDNEPAGFTTGVVRTLSAIVPPYCYFVVVVNANATIGTGSATSFK